MGTNQPHAVMAEYTEYPGTDDLDGACIHCVDRGTTCAASHPTATQWLAQRHPVAA
jgi:hypothetical protein